MEYKEKMVKEKMTEAWCAALLCDYKSQKNKVYFLRFMKQGGI